MLLCPNRLKRSDTMTEIIIKSVICGLIYGVMTHVFIVIFRNIEERKSGKE